MKISTTRRARKVPLRLAAHAAAVAIASISLGTLAACGSSSSSTTASTADPAASSLHTGAAKEGTLTWYTSVDTDTANAVVSAFKQAYPDVNVELLRLTTGEVTARYAQERSAGSAPADVVTVGDPDFFDTGAQSKWFTSSLDGVPDAADWPKDDVTNGIARVSMIPLGITYNTDMVKTAPTSWQDVLDPAYAGGKLQIGDPRNVPAYMQLDVLLQRQLGTDFLKKVDAQKPQVFPSVVNAMQTVAAGGAAMLFPGTKATTDVLATQGAPVAFAAVSPTVGVEFYSGIASNATHPDAAKLFTDYLLSKDGQTVLNKNSVSPLGTLPGTNALPDGYQTLRSADITSDEPSVLAALGLE